MIAIKIPRLTLKGLCFFISRFGPIKLVYLGLFIEVPVSSSESKWSCICMLGVSSLSLSTIFLPIIVVVENI